MPPQKRITKEMILEKAFFITQTEGYESITVRSLACELSCSTQPIYQEFKDMSDLKVAIMQKTCEYMANFITQNRDKSLSSDLANIIAYIQFANAEKRLFQLIFTSRDGLQMMQYCLDISSFNINMIIYANGIIMMNAYKTLDIPFEEMKKMIIKAYEVFK
ncbi:TetR/AcrR family transcriptional regulator [[Clostridium] fimetarium]|uniref:HTH tetR-type domain-containing protein n=1 Tax=[Clostridium] fimetarium TaxID=99656 RepID=A0A1I0PIB2_9FIRM|nr:TetR/AcrR family transcriptional regulator [[Clostridium] fimetarium]SEW14146.1 hypothetical protein SAMN05421659_105110 [[Clostridium] fimetarium]